MVKKFRTEHDSMGPMRVPTQALYGASTARAVANFPISGRGIPPAMVHALGWVKWAAAQVNAGLGLIPKRMAGAIMRAAREVASGKWDAQFPVDIYQTGSGTSSNMNANEVIAHRARAWCRKSAWPHPNDHANFGQSSNDVFPTAIHLASLDLLERCLQPALAQLESSLRKKARQFAAIVKSGRTHLQDATPILLGQEFSGYTHQLRLSRERFTDVARRVAELPLGGTAVGTGVNTHSQFARRTIGLLRKHLRLPLRETRNHFQAQAAPDALVELAAALKCCAVALMKIGNDLRWLASGPHCGLGELQLPAVQPGSSIMPGKVNPVVIESLLQVCARVVGNDMVATLCGQWGNFELNTMYPLLGASLCESLDLLSAAAKNLAEKCIDGVRADPVRCAELLERNLSTATVLAPVIGYDTTAALVKRAVKEGKTLREILTTQQTVDPHAIKRALDPIKQTRRGLLK